MNPADMTEPEVFMPPVQGHLWNHLDLDFDVHVVYVQPLDGGMAVSLCPLPQSNFLDFAQDLNNLDDGDPFPLSVKCGQHTMLSAEISQWVMSFSPGEVVVVSLVLTGEVDCPPGSPPPTYTDDPMLMTRSIHVSRGTMEQSEFIGYGSHMMLHRQDGVPLQPMVMMEDEEQAGIITPWFITVELGWGACGGFLHFASIDEQPLVYGHTSAGMPAPSTN